MNEPTPDASLRVAQLQRALVHYQGPLGRYAARITGDTASAADAVQETFLRLWSAEPQVAAEHLAQWLFTVCRNAALDIRRKDSRMGHLGELAAMEQAGLENEPSARLEAQESTTAAMKALAGLSENQQEVVRLKFQNGFTYQQIAGITGLSVSNVGFLLHTAIKNIRQKLAAGASPSAAGEGALP